MIKEYTGGLKIPIKNRVLKGIPIDIVIKIRNEGALGLYVHCDKCNQPRPHKRIPGVIQCIYCGFTKFIGE